MTTLQSVGLMDSAVIGDESRVNSNTEVVQHHTDITTALLLARQAELFWTSCYSVFSQHYYQCTTLQPKVKC